MFKRLFRRRTKKRYTLKNTINTLAAQFPPPCDKYKNRPHVKTHISGAQWCSTNPSHTTFNNVKTANMRSIEINGVAVNVYVIPAGKVFYHGWHTSQQRYVNAWKQKKLRNSPMFLGAASTARSYASKGREPFVFWKMERGSRGGRYVDPIFHIPGHTGGITKVKTTRPIVLYAIDQNASHFCHMIKGTNQNAFFNDVCALYSQLKPKNKTVNIHDIWGKTNMITPNVLNMTRESVYTTDDALVKIICKLPGIDGWIYNQKNVNKQIDKEVVICKPTECLTIEKTEILPAIKPGTEKTPTYSQFVRNKKYNRDNSKNQQEINMVVNGKKITRWHPWEPSKLSKNVGQMAYAALIRNYTVPNAYYDPVTGRKRAFVLE